MVALVAGASPLSSDTAAATSNPADRALQFEKRTWRELHPFWQALRKQDLSSIRRAKNEQNPHYKPRLKARLIKSFADDAVTPASRSDIKVMRALMPAFHMLEKPGRFLLRPGVMARIFWIWMQPKSRKAHLYPPKLGPDRTDMLRQLGLKGAPA